MLYVLRTYSITSKFMDIIKALTLSLGDLDEPVITSYMLGKTLHALYRDKKYKGEDISKLQKEYCDKSDYNKYVDRLLSEGILAPYKGMPNTVFSLLGRKSNSAEDIACTVDPFCYVSHLSAMSYHGLTNRIPSKLHLSTPGPKHWQEAASKKMEQELKPDLSVYIENRLPKLQKVQFQKIGNKEIHLHHSSHLGAYKRVKGRPLRVSSIGRTFLEMLRDPQFCGGMNHALEVFDEHAKTYLRLITDEVSANGTSIEKVRAGYILSERLGLSNEAVLNWKNSVQRGGSRKLDPSAEYVPVWSDTWCISLNIFENSKDML